MPNSSADNTLISDLLDGELSRAQQAHALGRLSKDANHHQACRSWSAATALQALLHAEGPVSATDATPVLASPGFSVRCAGALDLEPAILAPNALPETMRADGVVDFQAERAARSRWQMAAVAAGMFLAVGLTASLVFSPLNTSERISGDTVVQQATPNAVSISASQANELEALMVEHGEFTGMAALNGLLAYAKVVNQQVDSRIDAR